MSRSPAPPDGSRASRASCVSRVVAVVVDVSVACFTRSSSPRPWGPGTFSREYGAAVAREATPGPRLSGPCAGSRYRSPLAVSVAARVSLAARVSVAARGARRGARGPVAGQLGRWLANAAGCWPNSHRVTLRRGSAQLLHRQSTRPPHSTRSRARKCRPDRWMRGRCSLAGPTRHPRPAQRSPRGKLAENSPDSETSNARREFGQLSGAFR